MVIGCLTWAKTNQRLLLGYDIDQVLALFGNFSDLPDMPALSRRRTFKSGEACAGFINAYTSSLPVSSTIYWMLPRTQNNWAFFSLRRISQSCLQIAIPWFGAGREIQIRGQGALIRFHNKLVYSKSAFWTQLCVEMANDARDLNTTSIQIISSIPYIFLPSPRHWPEWKKIRSAVPNRVIGIELYPTHSPQVTARKGTLRIALKCHASAHTIFATALP